MHMLVHSLIHFAHVQITNVCGNGVCESEESSETCSKDCFGPAYEFGASILVTQYSEDVVACDKSRQCSSGYRQSYRGQMTLQNVEMRYYGQKEAQPGITVNSLGSMKKGEGVTIDNVAMNRGYSSAVSMEETHDVIMRGCVMYRSHLPAVTVQGNLHRNSITNNLGVVSLFTRTHRGLRIFGLVSAKLEMCRQSIFRLTFVSAVYNDVFFMNINVYMN
jgi:hypothetical protein